jgi:hypothetical protein
MSQKHRESKERRLFGASFVLARETLQSGFQVMVMRDTPKREVSAGFNRWVNSKQPAWSYPGGGRANNQGFPETRSETLQNELYEEMSLLLPLSFLDTGKVQKIPFLVGQYSNGTIHQIGVTSALYWFDSLPQEDKKFIEDSELKKQVIWLDLEKITIVFQHLRKLKEIFPKSQVRPQLYTTSFLWYLDLVLKLSFEEINDITNKLNKLSRQFLVEESDSLDILITNGAFSENGDVLLPELLSSDDRDFLYGSTQG